MSIGASDFEALLERLERLENQNRRFKYLGLAVLLLAGAGLLTAQTLTGRDTVEAQEFVLRDEAGKLLASLGTQQRHGLSLGPALRFFDSAGKLRAEFGLPDAIENPSLNLISGDNKWWAHLDLHTLNIGPRGGSGVYVSLMAAADGSASLNIDKANQPSRVVLGLAPDGSPSIILGDKTGKVLIGATSVGRTGVLAGKLRPTPSVALFGPNWEPLWETPQSESKESE